ncbi:MAG: CDP-diacylglycerol--glycerol-3-phosphate 3-phosphatidyltransferase [Clostridia bacterium]|nr:CDP-diacylglycerol--glycerol-3-phosphate 3-phosphatidyltransferase [Clostridia bacterium]
MTTPNKLTIARIALSPVFLFFLLFKTMPHHYLAALLVFIAASVTDLLDGKMARRDNTITTFGKFLDPLADKVLVSCALVGMVELSLFSSWFTVIILTREFLVTSVRLIASGKGKVIAANYWGKVKTVTQIVAIISILVFNEGLFILERYFSYNAGLIDVVSKCVGIADVILISAATLATVVSGIIYIKENIGIIMDESKG